MKSTIHSNKAIIVLKEFPITKHYLCIYDPNYQEPKEFIHHNERAGTSK